MKFFVHGGNLSQSALRKLCMSFVKNHFKIELNFFEVQLRCKNSIYDVSEEAMTFRRDKRHGFQHSLIKCSGVVLPMRVD